MSENERSRRLKKGYHNHLRITHNRVCERERENDLHFERRNVSIGGYVIHGIEEPKITFVGFCWAIC
jgi:hypothetical protein